MEIPRKIPDREPRYRREDCFPPVIHPAGRGAFHSFGPGERSGMAGHHPTGTLLDPGYGPVGVVIPFDSSGSRSGR
jgi:hypothetical protein